MNDLVTVCLDIHSVLTLLAGGKVEVPWAGIVIVPGSDLGRIQHRVKVRVNGGVAIQGPPAAKEVV